MINVILDKEMQELIKNYPFLKEYFLSLELAGYPEEITLKEYIAGIDEEFLHDKGIERNYLLTNIISLIQNNESLKNNQITRVKKITIIGGRDKTGKEENCTVELSAGEIICIVGPTGSGKSRLLADIEYMAQKDTPTGRQILIDNQVPEREKRFFSDEKLVAQLSQNMNFVMDVTVGEFLLIHAESRMIEDTVNTVNTIIMKANELAGEAFSYETPLTSLSGGQSRALMIADTAYLSKSPVVLIDEIENAGIDRRKALNLLVRKEKIILMATHDPILILMGDKRLVIKNGGISEVIVTSEQERRNLERLEIVDSRLMNIRNLLRNGGRMESEVLN
ncbi:MAG: ATP-binding cassette domain-containing protein [Bacillota bacterium]|nr:ATP-binding cassette domain-containing protein [Bacillota bacterium]